MPGMSRSTVEGSGWATAGNDKEWSTTAKLSSIQVSFSVLATGDVNGVDSILLSHADESSSKLIEQAVRAYCPMMQMGGCAKLARKFYSYKCGGGWLLLRREPREYGPELGQACGKLQSLQTQSR
jgi:hypothetical protein